MIDNLVSVIMPNYNGNGFVGRSIESVLNQSYVNFELFVIDDCSTDDSYRLILDYAAGDDRIKPFRLSRNSGAASARNKGIELAEGRYLAFIDNDDLWDEQFLEKMLNFMKSKNAILASASYRKYLESEDRFIKGYHIPEKISYRDMLRSNRLGCLATVYDTGKLGKKYMEGIVYSEDYTLWLKILREEPFAYGLDEFLATYIVRGTSKSRNKLKKPKVQWKIYREIEKLSFLTALYYFTCYAYNGFMKNREIYRLGTLVADALGRKRTR